MWLHVEDFIKYREMNNRERDSRVKFDKTMVMAFRRILKDAVKGKELWSRKGGNSGLEKGWTFNCLCE